MAGILSIQFEPVLNEIDKNLNLLKGYIPTQQFTDHILCKRKW